MACVCSGSSSPGSSRSSPPMIPLQIVSVLFALSMLYWTYLSYRQRAIRFVELLFWWIAWGAFAVVVIFPRSTNTFLERLNVNRTMDLMLIVSFMMVWVVLFANHLETRRLRKRLHDLVREIALKDGHES